MEKLVAFFNFRFNYQGIAYEQEDYWNMYYLDDTLDDTISDKYPLTEYGYLIGSVSHTEIDTPSDLDHFFRAWLVKESAPSS